MSKGIIIYRKINSDLATLVFIGASIYIIILDEKLAFVFNSTLSSLDAAYWFRILEHHFWSYHVATKCIMTWWAWLESLLWITTMEKRYGAGLLKGNPKRKGCI